MDLTVLAGVVLAVLALMLVVSLVQRLLKLAFVVACALFLAGVSWVLLRDHAPPDVRDAVDAAAAEAGRVSGEVVEEAGVRAREWKARRAATAEAPAGSPPVGEAASPDERVEAPVEEAPATP